MLTAHVMERGDAVRRAYRREIKEARQLGVPDATIAEVCASFAGEHPEPEVLRVALQQYVPARMLFEDADEAAA